ncbi:MAG: undecaprenyl pyrophosphate phosphatase [Gammaproteobacteria bacterium]|jgi:hypothetical protein|nr:undecaprenyl pyrophosphate phosphatase [Gammaproteobacteria bacterium]
MNLAKKFAIAFAIAIIFPMLVYYGAGTFYPQPNYNNYPVCKDEGMSLEEREVCAKQQKDQMVKWDAQKQQFGQWLFYIGIPLGLLAIIVGALTGTQAVGSGLIFGGVFTIIQAYFTSWAQLESLPRFISLILVFAVVVWVGHKTTADKSYQQQK